MALLKAKGPIPVELIIKIVELIVGFGIGVLFDWLYESAPKGLPFVVGLLSFMACELIISSMHGKRYHEALLGTIAKLAEEESKASAERALIQLGLAYSCREEIGKPETADAWNRLTWAVQNSYKATNYIDIPDLYKNRYAEDVLSVQKAKVRALKDFKIKKVFLLDKKEELLTDTGRDLIKEHQDHRARMEVKTVLLETVDERELERIGGKKNLDFAIFDCQVVLVWRLDEKRKIVGSKVIVGQEVAQKFESFFDHLFTAGQDLSEVG